MSPSICASAFVAANGRYFDLRTNIRQGGGIRQIARTPHAPWPHLTGASVERPQPIPSEYILSTGTWHIIINNQAKTSLLDPKYDMLCNIDIYGKKNPTIRFMGGREYEYLCSELKINKNLINSIDYDFFNYKKFLLPSFAEGGPFKLKKINIKKYLNKPIIFRYMLINSYIAFVMNFCLSKIKSNNKIIIDGPLAKNITILRILKDLRKKQEIYINFDTEGTVKGVNLLFNMKKKNHIKLKKIKTYSTKNLNFYYNLWLSKIKERKLLNN